MAQVEMVCYTGIRTAWNEAIIRVNEANYNTVGDLIKLGNLALKQVYKGKRECPVEDTEAEIKKLMDSLNLEAVLDIDCKGFLRGIEFIYNGFNSGDLTVFGDKRVALKIYEGKRKKINKGDKQ